MVVLVKDSLLQPFYQVSRGLCLILYFELQTYRWNSDLIPDLQLIIGLATLFVDPYLALSDDTVNTITRHIAELFKQEIVEPLIELGGSDLNQNYGCFLWLYCIQWMAVEKNYDIFAAVALYCLFSRQNTTITVF
jgi:hypothetical protein